MKKTFSVLFCFMLLFCSASAHAGRTDAAGGHWDRSSGTYHYHHGYPAHQHPNGICPYNYDDQTGSSSGASYGSSSSGSSIKFTPVTYTNADGDYGYEAETDFETKRDAYYSGFEWGVEYSSSRNNPNSAYTKGYDEGYNQGRSEGESFGYDEGHQAGYDEGYDYGYDEGYNRNVSGVKSTSHREGYEEATSRYQNIFRLGCIGFLALILLVYFRMKISIEKMEANSKRSNAIINEICLRLNKSYTKTISQNEVEEIFKKQK